MTTVAFILSELFLLDGFRCNFLSSPNFNTLYCIIIILHSYVEQVMMMCQVQEWQLLLSYFLNYFPLMMSDAISCPLLNLNSLWCIIMILYSNAKLVMKMCHAQEWQLSLSYFLGYFPLIVLDAISCLLPNLNALWYIIMILYSYMNRQWRCVAYKNENSHLYTLWVIFPWWSSCDFVSALYFEHCYEYFHETVWVCRRDCNNVPCIKNIAALMFILLTSCFPWMNLVAALCLHHNFSTS